jgi:hypothetical protein
VYPGTSQEQVFTEPGAGPGGSDDHWSAYVEVPSYTDLLEMKTKDQPEPQGLEEFSAL